MDNLYIVVELQKNDDQLANIVTSHNTLADAQYKFHTIAASAAISVVEKHTVILIDDEGFMVNKITFEHPVE